ncbi:r2r3-MYB transcription factor [Tritrichomonas foetus]|uniref:R2r3-MYB transcription factor n=1 Tax=Tritrichomonas foetus TaxID=1144522 RepID=A0A1J4JVU8_9EUKA|nr:r2r3-MYB transcription factor [Tritrichomonas foetus]|eukprot:OHT01654.1 r2r3-MYB transcription factor [Tritrichomonas foetus]
MMEEKIYAAASKIVERPIKKSKFTREEDSMLLELVQKYGENSWILVSKHMICRSAKQCRDRYMHTLKKDISDSSWTDNEDILLLSKYAKLGPKWSKISHFFTKKTESQLKNRYWVLSERNKQQIKNRSNGLNSTLTLFHENDSGVMGLNKGFIGSPTACEQNSSSQNQVENDYWEEVYRHFCEVDIFEEIEWAS